MFSVVRARGRVAASLAVSLGLMATAGAVTTSPAQSVEPAGDCPSAYPLADVIAAVDAGQEIPVEGKTVSRGTVPEQFTGTVFGVIDDGIAPGVDMIMAELSSDALTKAGGVWSGMSGSPVYDPADGRLIGAVSYGLSWGPSPIAGITPYAQMATQLAADPGVQPARQVDLNQVQVAQVAAESSATPSEAGEGFSRLRMPRSLTGMGGERLAYATSQQPPHGKARPYVRKYAATVNGARASAAEATDLVAGGNLAATVAYGDLTMGGVGTVTAVCGNRLVGFGHPMTFSGQTSLGLHPASAVFVQPESLGAPFKVANIGAPVGTIDQDRTAGISGFLGNLPDTMDVTSSLTYGSKSNDMVTSVSLPTFNADMTFYEQLANHDAVLESYGPGSEDQNWTITGTDNGTPFSLGFADMYASDYDIAFESPWDVADAVYALSQMSGVDVDTVEINGEIADDHSTWRVVQVQQRRGGKWVTLARRKPAIVASGGTLNLRAVLENGTEDRTIPLSMHIPRRATRGEGMLMVAGGGSSWDWLGGADTVDQLEKKLSTVTRNDQVEGRLFIESRHHSFERQDASDRTGAVVMGRRMAGLVLR
ncbi:MAG TPA: hypothetical protein VFI99_07185 [Nocardioides sp.]|jgi:hypothetical protein|nr:hypothetical protein [Nocardioides sp.]